MKFCKGDLIKSQLLILLIFQLFTHLNCLYKFKNRVKEGLENKYKMLNVNSTLNNSNLTSLPIEKLSFSDNVQNFLNNTFLHTDKEKLSDEISKPEYLMSKSQVRYILSTFIMKNNEKVSENTLKGFYTLFLKSFRKNDKNNDNSLSLEEFDKAFKGIDPYLSEIYNNFLKDDYLPFPDRNGTAKDSNSTILRNDKKDYFIKRLFNLFDSDLSDHLTFYNYLQLRLILFSWKKCSVLKPFVSESEFICTIAIINSSSKSNSYEMYKKLFRLGILLSNPTYKDGSFTNLNKIDSFNADKSYREKLFSHYINPLKSIRYLDFSQYAELAVSTNLFSIISPKTEEITRSELDQALSDGILPRRFNSDIINVFSNKNNEKKEFNDIDLITFVFRDYFLRKFFSLGNKYKVYEKIDDSSKKENDLKKSKSYKSKDDFSSKKIKYQISMDDFTEIVNNIDFPEIISQQLFMLPYKKRTKDDYQKEVTLKHDIKYNENDYLLFVERDNVKKTTTTKKTVTKKSVKKITSKNQSRSMKSTISNGAWYIFSSLDLRNTGTIDFKGFLNFIETFYLFHQTCLNKEIYYTSVSDVNDFIINYTGFPSISIINKQILNQLKQHLRIDAYNLLILFTFEQYFFINKAKSNSRPHLSNVINELALKEYLNKIDSEYLPMGFINELCLLKDTSENLKGPEVGYDIVCSITKAVEKNLEVKHANEDYEEVKEKKLKLDLTGFYNFKPNI